MGDTQLRSRHRASTLLLAMMVGVLAACGSDGDLASDTPVPGLNAADEVPITEVDVDGPEEPQVDDAMWLRVADLPPIVVGPASEEFLRAAHRDDPAELICVGGSGSLGCAPDDPESPAIAGLTFGTPQVEAWSWSYVPEEAAAVRFTDESGTTSWQRPVSRTVVFPRSETGGEDCDCLFEAIDADGTVLTTVDLSTGAYVDR